MFSLSIQDLELELMTILLILAKIGISKVERIIESILLLMAAFWVILLFLLSLYFFRGFVYDLFSFSNCLLFKQMKF